MRTRLRVLLTISLALLASCVSDLHVPAKDLVHLGHDEGRVFGSVEVLVAAPETEATRERSGGLLALTGTAGLFATDAAHVDFKLIFTRNGRSSERALELRAGAPRAYASRLEQGEYALSMTCSQTPGENVELEPSLFLGAGETLYLGRLQLLVPARIGELGTLPVLGTRVVTRQSEDLALLGEEYCAVLPDPTERLLR